MIARVNRGLGHLHKLNCRDGPNWMETAHEMRQWKVLWMATGACVPGLPWIEPNEWEICNEWGYVYDHKALKSVGAGCRALRASLLSQDLEGYFKLYNTLGRFSGRTSDHETQDLPIIYRWWWERDLFFEVQRVFGHSVTSSANINTWCQQFEVKMWESESILWSRLIQSLRDSQLFLFDAFIPSLGCWCCLRFRQRVGITWSKRELLSQIFCKAL